MRHQSNGIPSFHDKPPPKDVFPRRYKDAPTTVLDSGYVFEWCPTHPHAHFGTIQQHRIVVECQIGRFLKRREVVHHKDKDQTNNEPGNLELFASTEEHTAEHARLRRAAPELVERIRTAASDRSVSFASLGMAPNTIAKICREHGIEWKRRGNGVIVSDLTERSVREALQGRTTLQAAGILGCHPMTLYNRFGHLLAKRTRPNALDPHCADILEMLRHQRRPQSEVAAKYGVSEACVMKSVQRWMKAPHGLDLSPTRLRAIFQRWSRRDAKRDGPGHQSTRHWSSKPGPQHKGPDKASSSPEPVAALPG